MTWLELIDELKKQPLYLLEQQAVVFCNEFHDGAQVSWFEKPIVELTSPYNDGSDLSEWLQNREYHLSAVIDFGEE